MRRSKSVKRPPPVYQDFECVIDGQTFRASYVHERKNDWVTVHSAWGSKSARAGASGAALIAKLLLGEIVRESKARGDR